MTDLSTPYAQSRAWFRNKFENGIRPIDARRPIPDKIAREMIDELIELGMSNNSCIGLHDAFLIMSSHIVENGIKENINLIERHFTTAQYDDLSSLNKEYYKILLEQSNKKNINYFKPHANNLGKCNMNFDYMIGNPPYQSASGGGSMRGSTTNPMWWEITKQSIECTADNGIISFITPINIVSGGDSFTTLFLGPERQYDLIKVDFTCKKHFPGVGINICRWVMRKSLTPGHKIQITDGRVLDASNTLKIYEDVVYHDIINQVFTYKNKLEFNTQSRYDYTAVERHLIKEGLKFDQSNSYDYRRVESHLKSSNLPKDWARDLIDQPDDDHIYPVNINGKIKYSRVKWKNYGVWRLFIPKMQSDVPVQISNEWEADGSTFCMVFDDEESALKTKSYLDDPIYKWIIEQTRVSGRLNGTTLSKLPNAPIRQVLTAEQISYIEGQL